MTSLPLPAGSAHGRSDELDGVPGSIGPDLLQTTLGRRSLLAGALGVAATAVVGVPVAQAAPAVGGHVLATYRKAGGADVLGLPVRRQVKRRISHHSTYGQRFEHGTVWWGSGVGAVDRPEARVRLGTAPNFRPVSGLRDVWRTGDLDGCTALEKRVVADLGIVAMIALNGGGDPSIPGVHDYRYPVSNAGDHLTFYRGYVTRTASRTAFGRAVRRVARTDGAALVHCQAGKDRTGWICDLLQAVAGVDPTVRDLDYLATRSYSGGHVELEWLTAARTELTTRYGTVEEYLQTGCGLSGTDLRRLRARLA